MLLRKIQMIKKEVLKYTFHHYNAVQYNMIYMQHCNK